MEHGKHKKMDKKDMPMKKMPMKKMPKKMPHMTWNDMEEMMKKHK